MVTVNCDHCDGEEETNIHVMRDCQLARFVWQHLVPIHGRLAFFACDYNEWIATNINISVKIDGGLEWRDVWATTCYYLWFWRNKLKFDLNLTRPTSPSRCILQHVENLFENKN
jgi:hypothetical protein